MYFKRITIAALSLLGFTCKPATAQYEVPWSTIDGGGNTAPSTNSGYEVAGTIAQPDATAVPMTGDVYSVTGGFWYESVAICSLLGDMNHDTLLDGLDVQRFSDCLNFGGGDCSCSDLDSSGAGDVDDIVLFVDLLLIQ